MGPYWLPLLIALIFLVFTFAYYPFQEKLQFDLGEGNAKWTSSDQSVTVQFVVRRTPPEDQLGLFYVTLARGQFKPGDPCRFAVRSQGAGSRRWFGLNPYQDVISEE